MSEEQNKTPEKKEKVRWKDRKFTNYTGDLISGRFISKEAQAQVDAEGLKEGGVYGDIEVDVPLETMEEYQARQKAELKAPWTIREKVLLGLTILGIIAIILKYFVLA